MRRKKENNHPENVLRKWKINLKSIIYWHEIKNIRDRPHIFNTIDSEHKCSCTYISQFDGVHSTSTSKYPDANKRPYNPLNWIYLKRLSSWKLLFVLFTAAILFCIVLKSFRIIIQRRKEKKNMISRTLLWTGFNNCGNVGKQRQQQRTWPAQAIQSAPVDEHNATN